jgi:hypothetical protein
MVIQSFLGQGFAAYATGQLSGFTATTTFTDAPGPGTAPISPPTGGFGIDGNLQANTPTNNIGDWLTNSASAGTGGNVLLTNGVPIDTNITYHVVDPYNANGVDNGFNGGNKFDGNPNSWDWGVTPVGDKVDINHGLVHFSHDSTGHVWAVVAGDRLSNKGMLT